MHSHRSLDAYALEHIGKGVNQRLLGVDPSASPPGDIYVHDTSLFVTVRTLLGEEGAPYQRISGIVLVYTARPGWYTYLYGPRRIETLCPGRRESPTSRHATVPCLGGDIGDLYAFETSIWIRWSADRRQGREVRGKGRDLDYPESRTCALLSRQLVKVSTG